MVEIYTDGACSGNPGPGGYGVYIPEYFAKFNGHSDSTTNNEMELMAVKKALEYLLRDINLTDEYVIMSDSAYVIGIFTSWYQGWVRKGTVETHANYKLIQSIVGLIDKIKNLGSTLKFEKVNGHTDCEGNNVADQLAVDGTHGRVLLDTSEPTIAIIYVATGKYKRYWKGFFDTLGEFFPKENKEIFIFSDDPSFDNFPEDHLKYNIFLRFHRYQIENQPWPLTVLNKFRYMCMAFKDMHLQTVKQVWMFDSKVEFLKEFNIPVDKQGLLAFPHLAWDYEKHDASVFTWGKEINPKSKAHIDGFDYIYCNSGIMGGGAPSMMKMAMQCNEWTKQDLMHCIIPMWHDESYWNKYLVTYPDQVHYMNTKYLCEIGNPKAHQEGWFNMRNTDDLQAEKQKIYNEK